MIWKPKKKRPPKKVVKLPLPKQRNKVPHKEAPMSKFVLEPEAADVKSRIIKSLIDIEVILDDAGDEELRGFIKHITEFVDFDKFIS